MNVLAAGATLGLLGGGQLGRMIALAAARLGFSCHVYCQSAEEPAVSVCAACTLGSFDDAQALARFAEAVDVVTLEWENVPLTALTLLEKVKPVLPSAPALRIAQDRGLEKRFAREIGMGTADFVLVRSAQELEAALASFPLPAILKATRMGYDGHGQVRLTCADESAAAWRSMGSDEGVLEAFVDFEKEISVIVARGQNGEDAVFPVVENIHKNHILAQTTAPAVLDPDVAKEAQAQARRMAAHLGLVGLLTVEFFVLRTPNEKGQRL